MKKLLALALVVGALGSAHAQTNVGVSIGIHQPGVYGRINIGNFPAPQLVYAQPMIIAPAPVALHRAPIYLYVPSAHQQNWSRYCSHYSACGQPVYFVQERWVRTSGLGQRPTGWRGQAQGQWPRSRQSET